MGTVTNPLGSVVEGMLQGHQLATQMQREADAHQAFITNQALNNQQMSMQDIMNRQALEQNARPVSPAGTVTSPAVAGPKSNLPIPGLPNDPGMPSYERKADSSRTVKYGGQQYELKTPEEQLARRVDEATQVKHASMTPIKTPDHLRALGMPDQLWVPDEHLTQYAETTGQLAPVKTPQAAQDLGYPEQVPFRNLPAVMQGVNASLNRQAENSRADATNRTRLKVAADANTTHENIAADNRTSAEKRAADRNATTLNAASIRRDSPTAGQAAVEDRFQRRQQEARDKEMRDLQGKEDAVHAQRIQLGQAMSDPKMSDADRTAAQGKLKTLSFQVQSYQTRKATLAGANLPPKTIQDKIPEGQQATGPDGHEWRKQGGILYFVK